MRSNSLFTQYPFKYLLSVVSKVSTYVLLTFFFTGIPAQASLTLDQSRVIISAQNDSGVVKINNPTDRDYLIQSWITDSDNNAQEELFVQPPLLKIKAYHKVALHIETINAALAQQPHERLYRLNVKEIPRVDKNQGSAQLMLVMLTRVKVLYRPDTVPAEMRKDYLKLKWQRANGKLLVKNPTPYYITFNKVWEGNDKLHPLKADMIAPGATLTINHYHGAADIHYTIINDYGDNSETVNISL